MVAFGTEGRPQYLLLPPVFLHIPLVTVLYIQQLLRELSLPTQFDKEKFVGLALLQC